MLFEVRVRILPLQSPFYLLTNYKPYLSLFTNYWQNNSSQTISSVVDGIHRRDTFGFVEGVSSDVHIPVKAGKIEATDLNKKAGKMFTSFKFRPTYP